MSAPMSPTDEQLREIACAHPPSHDEYKMAAELLAARARLREMDGALRESVASWVETNDALFAHKDAIEALRARLEAATKVAFWAEQVSNFAWSMVTLPVEARVNLQGMLDNLRAAIRARASEAEGK